MVIDSSAIASILFNEPECTDFLEKISADNTRLLSAATLVEIALVVEARKGEFGRSELELFIIEGGFEIVAFDSVHDHSTVINYLYLSTLQ